MDELTAWLTLNRAPALERSSFHALRQHFAGVSDIVAASARALRAAGASKGLVDWLASPPRESIDADRRWLDCESHHFICLESPDYPPLLGRLDDAPLGLFVRGSPSWLAMPQLAMVGARHRAPRLLTTLPLIWPGAG